MIHLNVDQNIFAQVAGRADNHPTASTNEVLTFVAGTNVSLTTDNPTKEITINSTASVDPEFIQKLL